MNLQNIKEEWNQGLRRVKNAEELAENNPILFDRYIDEFNKVSMKMSELMRQYEALIGEEIPQRAFENGFNL
jgi:hypothetical protein